MEQVFTRSLRKIRGRERFYSSMTHAEYCDYFGPPPTPVFKPQLDPEEIPQLVLDDPFNDNQQRNQQKGSLLTQQLQAIQEVEGSENQTVNEFLSPKKKINGSKIDELQYPKRGYSRMRSQSQNTQSVNSKTIEESEVSMNPSTKNFPYIHNIYLFISAQQIKLFQ